MPSVMLTDLEFQIWPAAAAPPAGRDRWSELEKTCFFEGFLSLTSRTSALAPKEMAGELFTTFLAIKKNHSFHLGK